MRVKSRQPVSEAAMLLGYVIDASASREMLTGLKLDWNTRSDNYSAAVKVEAGDDLKTWSALVNDAPLVSLTHASERLD